MPSHSQFSILNPRRIVVRGVNWLGDAVMTTPALMRLRERFPEAHITILVADKLKDLWLNHPAVNEVISFGAKEGMFSISRRLRAAKFDLALVLPNSPRSALEMWLARIPRRVGYQRPWRNFFLTTAVPSRADAVKMRKRSAEEVRELVAAKNALASVSPIPPSAHQIHDYLHLVGALGAETRPLPPQLAVADSELESFRKRFGIRSETVLIGLNAGAEYGPAKRWPVENFAAAAYQVWKQIDCAFLVLGGKADVVLANEIEQAVGSEGATVHNVAGKTNLRELCAGLKLCRVLLSNDTGPTHVAAALGTPVVVPFGSTSIELTGPGLPGDARHSFIKSTAPCSPCFLRDCPIDFRCMKGIAVESVVAATLKALREKR